MVFIEGFNFSVIVQLLFGSEEDGFVNLHSLILIIGMMIIVQISNEAGVFQFIASKLIKFSGGNPIKLMIILCSVTVLISAILNNILAVIILIPLTITISRILNINPSPYILTQAVLVNVGGTVFSISSIPNILITTTAGIEFLEFFLNVGLVSLFIFILTTLFFILIYRKELVIAEGGEKILEEFNVWNVVQNKNLLYKCSIVLIILFTLFVIVPSSLLTPDIIALSLALILVIISKLDEKEIISSIDFELIFYLIGIFIIAGGLELTGVTEAIGVGLLSIGDVSLYIQMLIVLWFSAYLSSAIDNIPITKVLIPSIVQIGQSLPVSERNKVFYSLAFGANWGDNLTPLGDNILVINLAEKNKRPISFKQFFKLGFITTNYQLIILSIYFTFLDNFVNGMFISIVCFALILIITLLSKKGPKKIRIKLNKILEKARNFIIR
ncbi:MAG: hypothetical protein KGD73_08700 [Candidatus Lokiarchaeota archaeon]|nr:hypothetical protein [Candidatus Lokiarchaeota archaeon]